MILVEAAPPPDAALPLAALKDHLRLGTGFSDDTIQDALLLGFLRAAIAAIEARTGKALLARAFLLTLSAWASPSRQPIPVAPVSAVASVTLVPATGAGTALDPAAWRLETDWARPALVSLSLFPEVPAFGRVEIAFTAGFGPTWDAVPPDLGQAALMLAAHYHDFRHDVGLGPGCMPFGVTALIERHRPIRLSGGAA